MVGNLSTTNPTLYNGVALKGVEEKLLNEGDLITIADRMFRWEYPKAVTPGRKSNTPQKISASAAKLKSNKPLYTSPTTQTDLPAGKTHQKSTG